MFIADDHEPLNLIAVTMALKHCLYTVVHWVRGGTLGILHPKHVKNLPVISLCLCYLSLFHEGTDSAFDIKPVLLLSSYMMNPCFLGTILFQRLRLITYVD
jgi:hypothetical protein